MPFHFVGGGNNRIANLEKVQNLPFPLPLPPSHTQMEWHMAKVQNCKGTLSGLKFVEVEMSRLVCWHFSWKWVVFYRHVCEHDLFCQCSVESLTFAISTCTPFSTKTNLCMLPAGTRTSGEKGAVGSENPECLTVGEELVDATAVAMLNSEKTSTAVRDTEEYMSYKPAIVQTVDLHNTTVLPWIPQIEPEDLTVKVQHHTGRLNSF